VVEKDAPQPLNQLALNYPALNLLALNLPALNHPALNLPALNRPVLSFLETTIQVEEHYAQEQEEGYYLLVTIEADLDILDNCNKDDIFRSIYNHRAYEGKTFLSATYAIEDQSVAIPEHYQRHAKVFAEGEDIPLPPYRGPGLDYEINVEPRVTLPYIRPYRQSEREI
ncbi:MAG: hypothetical protein Q9190_008104, partial [Brigantiaea leucoxantha]